MPLVATATKQTTKQDDKAQSEEKNEKIEGGKKEFFLADSVKSEEENVKKEENKIKNKTEDTFQSTRAFVLDTLGIIVEIRKKLIKDIGAGKTTEHEEKHDTENITEELEETIQFTVHKISGNKKDESKSDENETIQENTEKEKEEDISAITEEDIKNEKEEKGEEEKKKEEEISDEPW